MRASRHPEAAFLAIMTASATHEVRNVLAIIKESAGLVEDICRITSGSGGPDQDKVDRSVGRINAQVKRGVDLLTNLNRLSHCLDQETATLDLSQEAELAVALSQRFAQNRRLSLSVREAGSDAMVNLHPLRLQMALFAAIESCMDQSSEGSAITVGVEGGGGLPVVDIRSVPAIGGGVPSSENFEGWTYLTGLVESLGATLQSATEGVGVRILFHPVEAP